MEGFKGLFTSGNCNMQGQVGSNANQFKNFMGNMNQTTPQLANIQQNKGNQNLDQLINNFDKIWINQQNNFQQEMVRRQQMKAPGQMAPSKPMTVWNADFVSPNFMAMQHQTGQLLAQPKVKAPAQKCPIESKKFDEVKIMEENSKAKEMREKQEEEDGLESARALIQMMENDGSPKFSESDFLKFLKKIDKGEVRVKNNKLVNQVDIPEQEESVERLVEQNFERAFAEAEEEFIKEQKETKGNVLTKSKFQRSKSRRRDQASLQCGRTCWQPMMKMTPTCKQKWRKYGRIV
jgi:hypothetical protein